MIPGFLGSTLLTIEPYAGNGGDGPVYGAAVPARGQVVLVRAQRAGKSSVAKAMLYTLILPANTTISVQDRVTSGGVVAYVQSVTNPGGPFGGHLEVEAATNP